MRSARGLRYEPGLAVEQGRTPREEQAVHPLDHPAVVLGRLPEEDRGDLSAGTLRTGSEDSAVMAEAASRGLAPG